jgi:DNA-binding HxlR family transcriptional regulator
LGDKWAPLVVMVLECGAMRYLALHNHRLPARPRREDETGISQRMLTLVLRNLEMNGMLARSAQSATAHRGEYFLTPLGKLAGPPDHAAGRMGRAPQRRAHTGAGSTYAGPRSVVTDEHSANDDCARSYCGHSIATHTR